MVDYPSDTVTKRYFLNMTTKIIILAAGHGTRMRSKEPKVLAQLAGKPILHHILDTCRKIELAECVIIGGYQYEVLRAAVDPYFKVSWKYQEQQLGTAHAVGLVLDDLDDHDKAIILTGDVPLINEKTLNTLGALCESEQLGIVTQKMEDPSGYGRIIRDSDGNICGIVEHKDANEVELKISEINTGIMAIPGAFLKRALPKIKNENAQNEFYLTDIIALAKTDGLNVEAVEPEHGFEVKGVNSKYQLVNLEKEFQLHQAKQYMDNEGVYFTDHHRVTFRGPCQFGSDVKVDCNVIFEGDNAIGDNSNIGANCILKNVTLEQEVTIEPMSILENVIVKKGASVGPYARLRPGVEVGSNAKIGNFVELKKSIIGEGSKVSHLSYIGDATIGDEVNIGAGTITCNYDGVNKYRTDIDDGAFIGSNSSLVAPVKIGKNSVIGAGSTIAKDAPANKLSLARAKQLVIEKWSKPTKK